ncbi:MAG TPA: hypothetical protein VLS25_00860, partial [Dehalococcoidia bacterium]|nr:hypothetical protein [Dehalococcoidia bacterium]
RHDPPVPPADLDDEDLAGLLRVAKARLDLAAATAHAGLQYEGAVWQRVCERLDGRVTTAAPKRGTTTHFERRSRTEASIPQDDERELEALEDIATLRKAMAEEMMAFAESHRSAVWQNVQARLRPRSARRALFSFFGRDRRDSEEISPALDGIVVGQTVWQTADSRMDELIELARKRRVLGLTAQEASSKAEQRVWSRISSNLQSDRVSWNSTPARSHNAWRRLAAGAAALAIIVTALGPIPETGFAGHPVVQLVQAIGEHIGVTEADAPPATTGEPVVITGDPVTAAEASQLLGVTVTEPATVPPGFTRTASAYYPAGLSDGTGVYLLTYNSADGVLMVFQEAASTASDLSAAPGAARDVVLSDGTPATLFSGAWTPTDGGFQWTSGGAQTLVFDRDGVRTVIEFLGAGSAAPDLTALADALK